MYSSSNDILSSKNKHWQLLGKMIINSPQNHSEWDFRVHLVQSSHSADEQYEILNDLSKTSGQLQPREK